MPHPNRDNCKEPLVLQVGGGSVKLIQAPLRLSGVFKGTEVLVPRTECRLCPWPYSSPLLFSLYPPVSMAHKASSSSLPQAGRWEVLLCLPPQICFSPPVSHRRKGTASGACSTSFLGSMRDGSKWIPFCTAVLDWLM